MRLICYMARRGPVIRMRTRNRVVEVLLGRGFDNWHVGGTRSMGDWSGLWCWLHAGPLLLMVMCLRRRGT